MQTLLSSFQPVFVLSFFLFSVILGNTAIAQTNGTSNMFAYERLAVRIANFETNKSIEDLRSVIDEIKYNQVHLPRRQQMTLWFLTLCAIDRNLDLNYGSVQYKKTNSFSINLTPPDPKYMSGIDPSAIEEPDIRAQYVSMLKTNREHAEYDNFQMFLHRIDKQISLDIEKTVRLSYGQTESDRQELLEILNKSALSNERKQNIQALLR